MPKRRIDPANGEPELTYREQLFADEFIRNGGNGAQATASAGYDLGGDGLSGPGWISLPNH